MTALPKNGFSMIEVLVTIVILLVGLLGLAGLQARTLTAQMESYQRSQALVLLKDMADRIDANRANAAAYATGVTLGTGYVCTASGVGSAGDLCAWSNALQGAAEIQSGVKVGAMLGARGCIYQVAGAAPGVAAQYVVVVAWQGFNPTAAPSTSGVAAPGNCGNGAYVDRLGESKASLHRVISLPINMADLKFAN